MVQVWGGPRAAAVLPCPQLDRQPGITGRIWRERDLGLWNLLAHRQARSGPLLLAPAPRVTASHEAEAS